MASVLSSTAIQIGNSDDKLTQREWAAFVEEVDGVVNAMATQIHFFGGSHFGAPWQNACWIFYVRRDESLALRIALNEIRARFRQDSIAILEGDTSFICNGYKGEPLQGSTGNAR